MMRSAMRCGIVLMLLLAASGSTAQPAAEYYRGKTITLTLGSDVGGGNDAYARLVARHLGRFIAGGPTIVVKNMPGAGGLRHLNYMYRVAPKDGTVIGTTQQLTPFEPLLAGKDSRAEFDPLKFTWLGSPERFSAVALSWHTSPVKTAEDLMQHELIVGAAGRITGSANDAYVLRNVLGFKFRVILGYPGGADVDLAMERGEIQGRSTSGYQGIKQRNPEWLSNRMVNVLYQIGLEKNPNIPVDVPLILDFAKTPEERAILELKFASFEVGYPYLLPPEVPADRAATVSAAFTAMMNDPDFKADAEKHRLDVNPISGQRIAELLQRSFSAPREIVDRLVEASQPPDLIETAKARVVQTVLNAVDLNGRRIAFDDHYRTLHASIGPDTAITIVGNKEDAQKLKPGMSCAVSYFGDQGQAVAIDCR